MVEGIGEYTQPKDHLMTLVSTALRQGELSGLSEMLKCIAEAVRAYGCILWEVAPGANLESEPPEGRLFVLAEWFKDKRVFATHNMPLTESANGAVIISQRPVNIPNIREDKLAYSNPSNRHIIDTMGLEVMCSAPVNFKDMENNRETKGTVSLYRNTPVPFSPEEFAQVKQVALLIPDLYQAIRDKVSRGLIYQVNEILHDADRRAATRLLSKDEMKGVLKKVGNQVAKTFQCIETSIFMEDRFEAADEYHLVSTTWSLWSEKKKDSYRAQAEEGITGWVLANKRSISIFSLDDFKRDKEIIQRDFPDIVWKDSLNIKVSARTILKLDKKTRLPPLSFMAAPIFRGDKVIGVIRCCTARTVPYYFAERELKLLELVAVQISRFWSNWLIRREIHEERQALVNGVRQLNDFVQQQLKRRAPSVQRIFDKTLSVAHEVVTGSDILDVRLFDDKTRELYFAATRGSAWREGSAAEVKARFERRFPVDDRSYNRPLGVRVYHSGTAMSIFDAEREGYQSKTFPQTKHIIVAPIRVQDKVLGVFDLRSTGSPDFPEYAVEVAEIFGQQLGLYYYLTKTIGELRQAEAAHVLREKERLQTNEDLAHQLKNPLFQAHTRIQRMLEEKKNDGERSSHLALALRGQIAKAKRVSMSTGLFAELAREGAIQIESKRLRHLKYDTLVRMLIEAAMDNEILTEPYRRIKFHVHNESFEVLNTHHIRVDPDLLGQAVSCLLDNAGKYSFPGTHVDISGRLTKGQSFHICVTNKGMPIKQNEIHLCKERLWRSEQAMYTTGEGSGIGLWVVDHIMIAHNGELLITPTSFEGVTQIKLIFPVVK
jgi:signal transduction histidine kinase